MVSSSFRALVVDDEPLVRGLTIRALLNEGFTCDAASDGLQAQELLKTSRYHVVVTDLRMPNRHGHALTLELLALEDRPAIVVFTGVLEPKLAKDLIFRGVELVEFKPTLYDLFAAKIRAVVDRRDEALAKAIGQCRASLPAAAKSPDENDDHERDTERLSPADVDAKLAGLAKIVPVSQAALDVFNMASSEAFQTQDLAAAIARDPSLSLDVLRLANSAFYNLAGRKTDDLMEAITRIGQKRIGEIALATCALTAMSRNVLPWMNVDLAWRRSIAAGVAVDALLAESGLGSAEQGLFLSAVLHVVGRIALGMSYPDQYQAMARRCETRMVPLVEYETRRFGLNHAEVAARLLETWNVPPAVYEPLKHVTQDYLALARLPEPLRTKVELVKLAILVGRIAVGPWEPWDRVEFPPEPMLRRLGILSFSHVTEVTRSNTEAIVNFRSAFSSQTQTKKARNPASPASPAPAMAYCNLSPEPFDFLAEIVGAMGIELMEDEADWQTSGEKVLVNCTWVPPYRLAARTNTRFEDAVKWIVTDAENLDPYGRFGRVLSLPASYAALRSACQEIARPRRGAP